MEDLLTANPISPFQDLAVSKLNRALGQEKASTSINEALQSANINNINSAQDLLSVANVLMMRGGFSEIVGRSLRAHAMLRGAGEY